ncbi:MAG: uncharacterized protein JWM82_398 [Myxococcales bacterium]|nr:uncharacterized protein [Myxococcales bacterium]
MPKTMTRTLSPAVTLAVIFLLATPAGATDAGAPKGTAAAATVAAKAPAASGIDWEHMTVPQKKKYMKTAVLPEAKKMFAAFDPKAYKKVTCGTCHGDGADEGTFKMPNPKLPKLPKPTSRADFVELQKKKPDAVKFMGTVVKPTMAKLLNLPEWSPDNTNGFGCYHCHTHD